MQEKQSKKTLRQLNREFSPEINPLMEGATVSSKERRVMAGMRKDLVDPVTGETSATAMIHRIKQIDDAEFVKVFSEGVKAMYGLTRTGMRVFQAILTQYQETKMKGGFADSVYLSWFNGGISGKDVGMSETTFHRGLKELILNKFISPREPNLYWVNPALFFKGDRVAFVKEYRRKSSDDNNNIQQDLIN